MTAVDLSLLFGLAAIWGASFLFIKVAVLEMSPVMLVSIRLTLAALGLLVIQRALRYVRASDLPSPPLHKMWRAYLYMGVMNAIVPYTLIAWGEERLASGVASILNATTPLFTALLVATVVSGGQAERLTVARLIGLLTGFAGVAVLVIGAGADLTVGSGRSEVVHVAAVLVASLAYGVSGLYGRRAFTGVSPVLPAMWQNVFGAVILLPAAWLLTPLTHWPSWKASGSAIALGIGGTAIALLLYYELLARVGATRTVMVTYLLPVMALVYGAVLLHEHVGLFSVLGLALVLGGVTITARAGRTRTTTAQATPGRSQTVER